MMCAPRRETGDRRVEWTPKLRHEKWVQFSRGNACRREPGTTGTGGTGDGGTGTGEAGTDGRGKRGQTGLSPYSARGIGEVPICPQFFPLSSAASVLFVLFPSYASIVCFYRFSALCSTGPCAGKWASGVRRHVLLHHALRRRGGRCAGRCAGRCCALAEDGQRCRGRLRARDCLHRRARFHGFRRTFLL
jgi:hypothetical protein